MSTESGSGSGSGSKGRMKWKLFCRECLGEDDLFINYKTFDYVTLTLECGECGWSSEPAIATTYSEAKNKLCSSYEPIPCSPSNDFTTIRHDVSYAEASDTLSDVLDGVKETNVLVKRLVLGVEHLVSMFSDKKRIPPFKREVKDKEND